MTALAAFEGETEAVSLAVAHRKAANDVFAGTTTGPSVSGMSSSGIGAAPQTGEHSDDDVEGTSAAVNRHRVGALQ